MNLFFFLAVLALLATLAILFVGTIGMAKGTEFNKKYGNKLMQARIASQAVAILFFLLWATT